jgi:hypothetical protein
MATGPYQSPANVIDFASRYCEELKLIVANRMRRLGIPEDMIGIRGYAGLEEGAFVRFPSTQIGGNVNPRLAPGRQAGIALDHGILDSAHPRLGNVPSWRSARLRDRIDAAIVHEYLEATLQPPSHFTGLAAADWLHREAVRLAPDNTMAISAGARRILVEYRRAEGLAP